MNIWKEKSAAWPVANPVVTCASLSHSGFPSNFVADPFLFQHVTPSPSLYLHLFIVNWIILLESDDKVYNFIRL